MPQSDSTLETAVARVSLLQDLTVAALDITDPRCSLDPLAEQLECVVCPLLERADDGGNDPPRTIVRLGVSWALFFVFERPHVFRAANTWGCSGA